MKKCTKCKHYKKGFSRSYQPNAMSFSYWDPDKDLCDLTGRVGTHYGEKVFQFCKNLNPNCDCDKFEEKPEVIEPPKKSFWERLFEINLFGG